MTPWFWVHEATPMGSTPSRNVDAIPAFPGTLEKELAEGEIVWESQVPQVMIDEAVRHQADRAAAGLSLNHGYKNAYLSLGLDDRPAFVPLRLSNVRYGVECDAICHYEAAGGILTGRSLMAGTIHTAPHPSCQCGFRALMMREHLGKCGRSWFPDSVSRKTACVLEVELTGLVIEGDVGFRAEHIRVLSVELPVKCWCCKRDTQCVVYDRRFDRLLPECGRHTSRRSRPRFSISELRGALETPVRIATQES